MSSYKELISEKGRNIQDLVESLQEVKLRMAERVGQLEEKLTETEKSKTELEERINSCSTAHEQTVGILDAQLQDFKKAVLQLEDEKHQLHSRISLINEELSGCKERNEELCIELNSKSEESGTSGLDNYYTSRTNEGRVSGKDKGSICQSVDQPALVIALTEILQEHEASVKLARDELCEKSTAMESALKEQLSGLCTLVRPTFICHL
ncbi:hypothetical protein PSACC_00950 [Paramicrosporidium saccamoebae]|uniref:Uncharacterized protein n=1 Tax=Paramicrosporidium saccamoebae TaxID=1246581 RepID=A0A2H9TNJ9_9FUNG|nr:hypothetical protein PSACC_00950 [Paramicrosporidium saccamoebae]